MKTKSKLKFAIAGCGSIAQRHAKHINTYAELVAVCDVVLDKALLLADQYNVKAFASINELLQLKNLDVVCICTPNGLHAMHAVAALQAGFHVLVEKPMALTVADCNLMIAAAERANKKLFVVKQNRFNPPVVAVKEAIDNGVLGKIFSIQLTCFWNRDKAYYQSDWKGTKALDGGILFTQFSHFIDLLYWMIGDVKHAQCIASNFAHEDIIEFEDAGIVMLEFNSGAIGTINYTINSCEKNMEGSLTIIAENGTVKIGGEYLNQLEYQSVKNFQFSQMPVSEDANDYGTYKGSMSNHHKVYEQLIQSLETNQTTNAFEAMKTVEIINKIHQSAKTIHQHDSL